MIQTPSKVEVPRKGFTLVEVLVTVSVVSLLMALGLPAIQQSREAARSNSCRNNLRQLGLAVHEHESAKQAFPLTRRNWAFPEPQPARSAHAELLPYLELATLYRQVDFEEVYPDYGDPPGALVDANRVLLTVTVPVFLCPSDQNRAGGCNYRCCLGTAEATAIGDGFFVNNKVTRPADILDGMSNTIMMSERVGGSFSSSTIDYWRDVSHVSGGPATDDADGWSMRCTAAANNAGFTGHDAYSGGTWLRAGFRNTWYLHAFPPNHRVPDCAQSGPYSGGGAGTYSARSYHHQIVNAVFGDGAVRGISQNISLPVWRALATRNGAESVELP